MKIPSTIRFTRLSFFRRLALQGTALAFACLPVTAAIVTWSGAAGDGSASNGGNWVGNVAATTGSDLLIPADAGPRIIGFDAGITFNAPTITFAAGAPAMTLTAAGLTDVVNVSATGTALSNQSLFRQKTQNLTIQVGPSTQTWDGGANGLSISAIDLQNNHTLTLAGTGTTATTRNEITFGIDGTGTSGIVKSGTGTLLYTGKNTYIGTTSINGGILQLGASERIANTSNLLLSNGAMLRMANFTETAGTMTIGASGGIIDFGVGAGNNSLILLDSSASSWAAGLTILNFNTGDSLKFGTTNGALTPAQLSNIVFQSGSATNGSGTQSGTISATGFVTPTTVPEPASAMLIGLGLMAIASRRRQRCG